LGSAIICRYELKSAMLSWLTSCAPHSEQKRPVTSLPQFEQRIFASP
jgi:hypothetical protein